MIEIKDYRLRKLEEQDLDLILAWRNSERIRSVMHTDHIISKEEHIKWFQRLSSNKNAECLLFEIKGAPIGVVNVTDIDRRHNTCEWGFYMGMQDRPPKSGTVMGLLGLKYIFEVLQIRKLNARILSFNEASMRYHDRFNFSTEGILKKQVIKNNVYVDIVLMALFVEDWPQTKASIRSDLNWRREI